MRTPAQEALIRMFRPARNPGAVERRSSTIHQTPIERKLGEILGGLSLKAWPSYPFGGYELDFALKDYLLDIEADGELFHSSEEKAAKRDAKDAWLASRGYRVLHLTGSVIMNDRPLVVRLIREEVGKSSPRPKTTIATLESETLATFEATVIRLKSAREVPTPSGARIMVQNGKIRDETGEVPLVLWGDQVSKVRVGERILLTDVWISMYIGHIQVSIGKRGKLESVTPEQVT